MSGCSLDSSRAEFCRNSAEATHLKLLSIVVILASSAAGISSPVALARLFAQSPVYANALLVIKCFAAGVILSTSLVHVLPDAFAALADCQIATRHPWRDFPFSGLVSLIGALLALLVDVTASSHATADATKYERIGLEEVGKGGGKEALPSVAAVACHGHRGEEVIDVGLDEEERMAKLKQRMVSQVLEIGIIFHSVIIGLTMGMSQNQCTIRPLVAALAFHQIFEGMGLGGCIAQVKDSYFDLFAEVLILKIPTLIQLA